MARNSSTRRGQVGLILGGGMALAVGAVAVVAMFSGSGEHQAGANDIFAAKRGGFDIKIPVSGELVAFNQIQIRNQLNTPAVITEIAAEGTVVNTGDVLLKFNDEELRVRLKDIIDEVNMAENAVVAAESEFDVQQKERESELAKANLAVLLADLALQAWKDGEDRSKRQRLALAHETASKNFERAKDRYEVSQKLLKDEFISVDECRNDEIAMIEGRSRLEQAVIDIEMYEKYESRQEEAKKGSDLDQARGELERTQQRCEAKVRSAQSELESKKYQLHSKRERKRLLEQQIGYCNINAPSPGLVVYASSIESGRWGWGNDPPRVGSQVWPNQEVLVLPDTSKMAAEVKVSEALSGMIKVGQNATVTSDANPGLSLRGEVVSIGVLAASGGFRDPNRRDYTVRISLNGGNEHGLKPAMRCKADIHVDRVEHAVFIPIQAINRNGPLTFVYVPDRNGYAQRKVTIDRMSETYTEITEGVNEGDRVLLREPQPQEITSRLPAPPPAQPEVDQAPAQPVPPPPSASEPPSAASFTSK